ncbi:tRNA-dihydrouridine(16/17) synthase [NAD(P)(+)]-like protein [Perkinsus chesapeaki]|uniref:tRNA-dihydrouridine(16/17) synthase [NAD(P)(+)] n=1 Tax=Perkinsus chesapeaki TaxID=330153 RepID=A0A7J6LRN4_PERCH|nr:tRNA-dihydrouridine(16/17) synthase [NAD(P)(+)]-like protein [Perkinsus chesapeaki]
MSDSGPSEAQATSAGRNERLHRYDWWRSIGSPRYVTAPMVDQSELAFRMMTRKYGAELCYTPMMHAKSFATSKKYRDKNFETAEGDSPLAAQFCGDNGDVIVEAAKHIQDQVSCVDLNLGCPQGIARRGHYGSFLLEEPGLVLGIVEKMVNGLDCPVSVKIRFMTAKDDDGSGKPDIEATKDFVRRLDALGVDLIALHPRTKEWKGQLTQACWWESAAEVRACVPDVPFIVNGGISSFEDVEKCFEVTKCDAVMSSECILELPTLFVGLEKEHPAPSQCELVKEYIEFAKRYPHTAPPRCIKSHAFRMLYAPLQKFIEVREKLGGAHSLEEISAAVDALDKLVKEDLAHPDVEEEPWPSRGYYWRHQKPLLSKSDLIRKKIIEKPEGMDELPTLGGRKREYRRLSRSERKALRKKEMDEARNDEAEATSPEKKIALDTPACT